MFKPQITLLITDYQYLFCRGSGHGVGNAQAQFLPHALEWVWKGYAPNPDK